MRICWLRFSVFNLLKLGVDGFNQGNDIVNWKADACATPKFSFVLIIVSRYNGVGCVLYREIQNSRWSTTELNSFSLNTEQYCEFYPMFFHLSRLQAPKMIIHKKYSQ